MQQDHLSIMIKTINQLNDLIYTRSFSLFYLRNDTAFGYVCAWNMTMHLDILDTSAFEFEGEI